MSAQWAKREAMARLRDQHGLNRGHVWESAYSPLHGTVGMRWSEYPGDDRQPFRVFNLNYPLHNASELVRDWVSVGRAREAKG